MFIDEVLKDFPNIPKPDGVFSIQNVAEYFSDNYLEENGKIHTVEPICLMPPFENTWFEYPFKNSKIGYFVNTVKVVDREENDNGFLVLIHVFMELQKSLIYLGYAHFTLKIDGCIEEESFYSYKFSKELEEFPEVKEKFEKFGGIDTNHFNILILALNFLHCKNVERQENQISKKLIKANLKRGKAAYFEKYYTLQIEPIKKILSNEGNIKGNGLQKALHICRGHFKTFDEKPMFGKFKGTFWVPAHTKGTISKGIIKKDYFLKIN